MKTLQLEQMAVMGRAEEPSVVACRMQLVFSTLEVLQSLILKNFKAIYFLSHFHDELFACAGSESTMAKSIVFIEKKGVCLLTGIKL